jgi:hypothetical protein
VDSARQSLLWWTVPRAGTATAAHATHKPTRPGLKPGTTVEPYRTDHGCTFTSIFIHFSYDTSHI